MWDVLAPPVEMVQVELVVVCLTQLEAADNSLPRMELACLVGLVAHLLMELAVSSSACEWAATWSQPHGLCVPCAPPHVLCTRR